MGYHYGKGEGTVNGSGRGEVSVNADDLKKVIALLNFYVTMIDLCGKRIEQLERTITAQKELIDLYGAINAPHSTRT